MSLNKTDGVQTYIAEAFCPCPSFNSSSVRALAAHILKVSRARPDAVLKGSDLCTSQGLVAALRPSEMKGFF